jgi:hypothetical protein
MDENLHVASSLVMTLRETVFVPADNVPDGEPPEIKGGVMSVTFAKIVNEFAVLSEVSLAIAVIV